jgi:hypothetical protein
MRIREAQKHMERTDPDQDADPQRWFLDFFLFKSFFVASYKNPSNLVILWFRFVSGSGSKSKIRSRPIWQFKQKNLQNCTALFPLFLIFDVEFFDFCILFH